MHVVTSTGARIPAVFFQTGHQGLKNGAHPLGTNYLPAVAKGYFVTELKPLEVVGHGSVVKNKVIPISKLPRLVGLGRMESGWEWLGGVERVTIL